MTSTSHPALILGGSGRTGSLVARHLAGQGIPARTASRHGSDVFFDWDDPATYPDALAGTDRVYLVTPVLRVRYAARVAGFLDQAEAAGIRHVTLLSTYHGDRAPREIDIAAVEADLAAREAFRHSILRPAWVMQNFTDDHLPVINGTLAVPSGGAARHSSMLPTSRRSRRRLSSTRARTRATAMLLLGRRPSPSVTSPRSSPP